MTIAFTGGGTGGHIYPGLAVAAELKKTIPGVRLIWLGSSAGIDRSIVEDAGIEFFGIPAGKLRRYFSFRTAIDFFKVIAGFFSAKKILKNQKTNLLFSKGGFVSVPPCAAAAGLGIPVFTHESDFSPGLATRLNAGSVLRTGGKIFTTYEDTVRFLKEKYRFCAIVSGQPVRGIFRNADPERCRESFGLNKEERLLLILGGSQGANEVNKLVQGALPKLTEYYTVVHQTGPNKEREIKETKNYKPYPYIKDELPFIMAKAEIVMGRSGAGIWEWAVCGKPMILIPLRGLGTRGDQIENARYFEKAGAAVVLEENADSQALADAVENLANNKDKRNAMAAASLKAAERNASVIIARVIKEKLEESRSSVNEL